MASEAGKGDDQRPGVGFEEGYDRIFASKPKAKPYGCNGNPRPVAGAVTHYAQDGWEYDVAGGCRTRMPRMVPVRQVMSVTCQFDQRTTDPRCKGCPQVPKTN